MKNFRASPIGLVPQKALGKFRIIHHLSYPPQNSINDGIPDNLATVKYASTDDAIRLIKKSGSGCVLSKVDIKSAFKIIPIHPSDHNLLGLSWDNMYYYDKTLPMGCRSSCAIFEAFSTAVEWIAKNELKVAGIAHILDDFLIISNSMNQGYTDLLGFQTMCETLGIPLAPEKTEGPASSLTFAGIELDTIARTARLPAEKLEKAIALVKRALDKPKLTLHEIQSVIGFLNFTCKVVVPGRAFLRRLVNLTIGVRCAWHKIRITSQAKLDLKAWLLFLRQFNGRQFFLSDQWLSNYNLNLYTDASGTIGYGAVFDRLWFHGKWPNSWLKENITLKECYPIVAAVCVWGHHWSNKRIMFHTDNEALVHTINANTTKDVKIMALVRKLVVQSMRFNIQFKAVHVPGCKNILADKLSRLQVEAFKIAAPHAMEHPSPVPAEIRPQNWFLGC